VSSLGLFATAIPALYAQRVAPPEDVLAGLTRLGIPADLYAAYVTALLAVFGLGCFAAAGVIAWRRSTDPMAIFVSLFLVLLGGPNHPNVKALAAAYPALDPVLRFSWGLLIVSLILFVLLFPDGRFVPRRMRLPIGLSMVGILVALFSGGGSLAEPPAVLVPILAVTLFTGTAVQVHRYRRVSSQEERQQTKWVVFGIAAAISIRVFSEGSPASRVSGLPRDVFPELTDREREILDLIAAGKNNQEIADALYLSLKTVRNYVSNIFTKLQVADRAQAIVRAREAGLGQKDG
jgi:DNA-binding CsgD family transcriptional regulator